MQCWQQVASRYSEADMGMAFNEGCPLLEHSSNEPWQQWQH